MSRLKIVRVSFHVGSGASNFETYCHAITAARAVFEAAPQLQMPQMHVLNIGGGFKENLLCEILKNGHEAIQVEEFTKDMVALPLMVIAKHGRFFVEIAFTLVTNVIGKRVRGERREYWIYDGIYGSFNLSTYDRSSMAFKQLLLSD
ncbi:Ornithine decarboxylase [Camellia lanceoleosa]|uniref:Ornithine decarboxylase n=1 Tax=Camellia lanceoleosa TaxID=1840588 RepID=A0ACC0FXT6_9ERIC|nr:Ornithine decarboxylase [Camellia lanceoleosa]